MTKGYTTVTTERTATHALATSSDSLATAIVDGTAYGLAFGGQGLQWLGALQELMDGTGIAQSLQSTCDEAAALIQPVLDDITVVRPDGFDPVNWALTDDDDRASLPSDSALVATPVSGPGVFLTQLAAVRALAVEGLDPYKVVPSRVIGHSQGIFAAKAVLDKGVSDAPLLALVQLMGAAAAIVGRRVGMLAQGDSSPMVAVSGVTRESLAAVIDETFPDTTDGSRPVISIRNAARRFIISGRPADLDLVIQASEALTAIQTKEREDKKRGGAIFDPVFEKLPIFVGFHHPLMRPAVDMVMGWLGQCPELNLDSSRQLIHDVMVEPMDWVADVNSVVDSGATYMLDMGPSDALTKLNQSIVRGQGVTVISAATRSGLRTLFTPGVELEIEQPWSSFAPRAVSLPDGSVKLETAFTRLTGCSPILLAGMTPTTVDPAIVAAAANAGHWAELAGGGQVTEEIFAANVEKLSELLKPGFTAQFNSLFLDPYLWKMQVGGKRLLQKARANGAPFDGVVITAGIPEREESVELIEQLLDAGIHYVCFKPGTVKQIKQVIDIASDVPDTPIIVHVEGGKAGGHHSWEDLDDLLIATYGSLRAQPNIVLCVGGGIGTPSRAADYLIGSWSTSHGFPAMPVDGILVGTAAMATLEATTSPQVKQLLVDTQGVEQWVGAGMASGGMASGRSQLGADIHEIDNSAAQTGRLLDTVAGDEKAVAKRRDEIIEALDATCKPYFGDTHAMTYQQWLERFAQLCGPTAEDDQWLDVSLRARFYDMVQRTSARLHASDHGFIESLFESAESVHDPAATIAALVAAYPETATTLLHPADCIEFIAICRTPGKPVPFVPVIDKDVRRWWRSDSLWQAHDARYSADEVCVIPGTVAVAGITEVDEPVGDLLDRFEAAAVAQITPQQPQLETVSSRRRGRVSMLNSPIADVLNSPDVVWAGRTTMSPITRLGDLQAWEIDAKEHTAVHAPSGARMSITSRSGQDATVELVVPISRSHLVISIDVDGSTSMGAAPVVSQASAAHAMHSLVNTAAGVGRGTAGGTELADLPAVKDGTATIAFTWQERILADHVGVTGSHLPSRLIASPAVPDALVGAAWPAVFAVLADAHTEDGSADVVEGILDLVHLDHGVNLHSQLPADGTVIDINASLDRVHDTELGRVVEVTVKLASAAGELATLTERFAIRGRAGSSELSDPQQAGGAIADEEKLHDTQRSRMRSVTVTAPADMTAFALVSGDHNPIHVDNTAAALAGLGDPIVHGMWLSATAQHVVQSIEGSAASARIQGWTVRMLAPVRLGADITINATRVGRYNGGKLIEVVCQIEGETVMAATALTQAPTTAYALPGQGIQHKGMGMDARSRSAAAREVWDRADKHTREVLGFSILAIVRENPTEVIINGERVSHPDGVLFLTQFTQVSMAVLAVAQFAELRENDLIVDDSYFAGHSVGEYNAIAAVSGVLKLESLIEIVYHRGMTMHGLIPRDEEGRSNYRLSAIRPSQMGIADSEVNDFVDSIAKASGEFLQIVNYNLAGSQYAIAGTVAGLDELEKECVKRSEEFGGKRSYIMIPGIDVPFHSQVLHGGVPEFRNHLQSLIPQDMNIDLLIGRYIPNLVPRPFTLDKSFVEEIADYVPAEPLRDVLADWDTWSQPAQRVALGRVILIELLAWQFASPVRWIETQDLLFHGESYGGLGVEQFVEIGVGQAPTIANLAKQTLALPTQRGPQAEIINIERDSEALYGNYPDVDEDIVSVETAEVEEQPSPAPEAAAPAAAVTAPAVTAQPGAAHPDDLPFGAAEASVALIALRTKVRIDQVADSDSIESLCDGVSSRRNQVLLDLGSELSLGAIDGAAEATIPALSDTVTKLARGYTPLGPVLTDAVNEQLRKVMGPSGKRPNYIAERVTTAWELGEGWAQHTAMEIALSAREGASVKGGDLAALDVSAVKDAKSVDALIDAAVTAVGARLGIAVAMPAIGSAEGAAVDAAALGEFTEHITGENGVLASAARVVLKQLGLDQNPGVDFDNDTIDSELADLVAAELGSDWPRMVAGAFDELKAVLLDDRWASAREDIARIALGEDENDNAERFTGAGDIVAAQARYWAGRIPERAELLTKIATAAESEFDGQYAEDVAVVTGASKGSIAAAVVGRLLEGGATVIATTSRLNSSRVDFYKSLYRTHARGNAALWVVPANMTSYQDVDALVEWIGNEFTETAGATTTVLKPALTPTLLLPFAAPSVMGSMADVGPRAEIEMRVLLWSVEKLISGLGALGSDFNVGSRLHVVLPGSPNRGLFGGDGAYGEAKAALDAVINRWKAETAWSARVTLVHAIIGWVKGTGLMGHNDPLVEAVEAAGVRTWTTDEMAEQLLQRCDEDSRDEAVAGPLEIDLTGGLATAGLDLAELAQQREEEEKTSEEPEEGLKALPRPLTAATQPHNPVTVAKDWSKVSASLDDMVVIVGAGEVGPFGSSRLRYEAELTGDLSAAGVIELAWTTGLIAWEQDPTPGWVVTETGAAIDEADIYETFAEQALARVGIREYYNEGAMEDGTQPRLSSVFLDKDFTFTAAGEAEARSYVEADPANTTAFFNEDSGEWSVTRAAGTEIRVPQRAVMTRIVGGQVPEGFDPKVWGIPADLADSIDRVSLWNMVATVDAFVSSGFSPSELLQHVHPADVANTQGTGMGGMSSLRQLYIEGIFGETRPNDVLQEGLPNVVAAHVMQSYVGGYGSMVHPVAACATTAVSIEEGCDKIQLGKADFAVTGGFDDLSIEGIQGFADMNATAESAAMAARGIEPVHYSRANDRRRGGFVESAGGGTILLARASVAASMGLPVLAVVGYAGSYADGAHTSIPAPGIGALGAARGGSNSRLVKAMSSLGITADDINVVSKHDTSTKANDPNESDLHERLARAMGRSEGNPLFVVSQKTLTGHSKGGAAAFQTVGLCQLLRDGVLPANRALDCVDDELAHHEFLVWLRSSLNVGKTAPLKAGVITSLGFGHVSGLLLLVNAAAYYAAVAAEHGTEVSERLFAQATERETRGRSALMEAMYGSKALFERPEHRRLGDDSLKVVKEREVSILLSENSRLGQDGILDPRS